MTPAHTLADVTRAQQLESFHSGSLVLARADGSFVGVVGDAQRVIFPRSAVKIIQALSIVESGAADHFALTTQELSLACASHSGSPYHAALAEGLLERIGLDGGALACGAHLPLGEAEKYAFIRSGGEPCRVHNNCSGKHAGMLATAQFLGEPAAGYELTTHAVQRQVKAQMAEVTGCDLSRAIPGIDGCSLPNWPVAIDKLAVAFARIVTGQGFSSTRHTAFNRLMDACWAAPDAMAGTGRLDTRVLERFAGDVFIKTGAEGVYCGGIRSAGIGFALKVDDGAKRAAEIAVGAVLARFVEGADDLGEAQIIENAAGLAVGDVRPGTGLMSVLERVMI